MFDQHLIYFEDALAKNDRGDFAGALDSWNNALAARETPHATWNRGQALLSLGRYREALIDYAARFRLWSDVLNFGCDEIYARLPPWRGEDIRGKRIVLLGEAGFGDMIMLARFIPVLRAMGAEVVLAVPEPLHRLLGQLALFDDDGDLCCAFFDLMAYLCPTPESVPRAPYLTVNPALRRQWHAWLPEVPFGNALSIGIAWARRGNSEQHRDFHRAIQPEEFVALLNRPDATLYSLQPNDREQAAVLGIVTPDYGDFADVAAVASLMDVIVSVDVAAIHVAGAIGHPNAYVMLPWLSSWRWLGGNVWYPHVKRCQQTSSGDWASAFAKMPATFSQHARSAIPAHTIG